jgi:hypothetical protein
MASCKECRHFFSIPEDADDFAKGKGDCVMEERDDKGKYWSARPTMEECEADKCPGYTKKIGT